MSTGYLEQVFRLPVLDVKHFHHFVRFLEVQPVHTSHILDGCS